MNICFVLYCFALGLLLRFFVVSFVSLFAHLFVFVCVGAVGNDALSSFI